MTTDRSSKYDLVDHRILVKKLEFHRVGNRSCTLMGSFLKGRKYFVEVQGAKSAIKSLKDCSVIQGSRLSALLYTLYVNEVPK